MRQQSYPTRYAITLCSKTHEAKRRCLLRPAWLIFAGTRGMASALRAAWAIASTFSVLPNRCGFDLSRRVLNADRISDICMAIRQDLLPCQKISRSALVCAVLDSRLFYEIMEDVRSGKARSRTAGELIGALSHIVEHDDAQQTAMNELASSHALGEYIRAKAAPGLPVLEIWRLPDGILAAAAWSTSDMHRCLFIALLGSSSLCMKWLNACLMHQMPARSATRGTDTTLMAMVATESDTA